MDNNAGAQSAEPEAKHHQLHRAIQNIDEVAAKTARLISRIQGPTPMAGKDAPTPIEEQPTLENILNSGASEINNKLDRIHQQLDELLNILF